MEFGFENELCELAQRTAERGARLFVVGGRVRNALLGLPVSDTDVTSALRPDEMTCLAREAGWKVVPKGAAFGMVEVHIGDRTYEHTTFRRDKYAEGGAHRPTAVTFSDTPDEDAFRRDFTVNALYADVLAGTVADPTGGVCDLGARLIRATSPDPELILRDDGLRIMRLCRFAAELGFDIEEKTFAAAKKCAPLLADISAERVRDELVKILMADTKFWLGGAVILVLAVPTAALYAICLTKRALWTLSCRSLRCAAAWRKAPNSTAGPCWSISSAPPPCQSPSCRCGSAACCTTRQSPWCLRGRAICTATTSRARR